MVERQASNPDYESCVAFYAGTLAPARAANVDRWLRTHPDIAVSARRHAACEQALRARFERVLYEPIPLRLQLGRGPRAVRWPQWLGMAAVIVLATTGGWWLGHRQVDGFSVPPAALERQTAVVPALPVRDMQPVAEQTHDGQAAPARQPNLSALGYALVSRQVLTNGRQPRTEFVYRNAAGTQVKIYARSRPNPPGRVPSLSTRDGMSLAQWRANGVDYALVGSLPPAALEKIARTAAGIATDHSAPGPQVARPIASGAAGGEGVAPVAGDPSPAVDGQGMAGVRSGSGL